MIVGLAALWIFAADRPADKDHRQQYLKAEKDGNFQDAYDGLRKLALDPADDPAEVGNDLTHAINCLQRLGRDDEIDDFREGVIAAHKDNWRLLDTAAQTYARATSTTATSWPASSIAATSAAAAAMSAPCSATASAPCN